MNAPQQVFGQRGSTAQPERKHSPGSDEQRGAHDEVRARQPSQRVRTRRQGSSACRSIGPACRNIGSACRSNGSACRSIGTACRASRQRSSSTSSEPVQCHTELQPLRQVTSYAEVKSSPQSGSTRAFIQVHVRTRALCEMNA